MCTILHPFHFHVAKSRPIYTVSWTSYNYFCLIWTHWKINMHKQYINFHISTLLIKKLWCSCKSLIFFEFFCVFQLKSITELYDNYLVFIWQGLFYKERVCVPYFRKRAKYLKIRGKMYKFENILKKGRVMRATVACIK